MGLAVITGIAGIIVGLIVMFFAMRNNPKYFNIDKMLKNKRDELITELKNSGIEILSK